MIGEEAPDQIVGVADAARHHVVGRQHQPCDFHRAHRQHRAFRLDFEYAAGERCNVELVDVGAVGGKPQTGHVGVQIGGKLRNPLQVFGIALAKMGRQLAAAHLAELEPAGDDPALAERKRRPFRRGPFFGFLIKPRSGLAERLGARVIGLERGSPERPARIGHPAALFEIDIVHGPAPAAPNIRAAAEATQPRRLQRQIGRANLGAVIERLGFGIE